MGAAATEITVGKGCYRQLSFSGLIRAPALALLGATSECPTMRPEAGPNLFAKVVSARPVFVLERNFLAPPYLFAKLLNEANI